MEKVFKALAYPPSLVNLVLEKFVSSSTNPLWRIGSLMIDSQRMPTIKLKEGAQATVIDEFWSRNTVYNPSVYSAIQSKMNIEWRFRTHPMFRELTGLYGDHRGEVVLDYGCGPGNDVAGFIVHSRAAKIIGMDISVKALRIAAHRASLHRPEEGRVDLMQICDSSPAIPLPDQSVDFVSSQGVLMHTSNPEAILREMHRVLKIGGRGSVMVYSRPSIWFDLYTAYEQMLLKDRFPGLTIEQVFTGNTDGQDCPMSRCFPTGEFVEMCVSAGFSCEYVGGYLTQAEMFSLRRYVKRALEDPRLGATHKEFLQALTYDNRGLPMFNGKYAGVSGVYQVTKKRPSK